MMRYLATFIVLGISVFALHSAGQDNRNQNLQKQQTNDTILIFNEITDVEKRLKSSSEDFERNAVSTIVLTPDTTIRKSVNRSTLLSPLRYRTNYLDSLYERSPRGTLIVPPRLTIPFSPQLTFRDTIIINPLYLPIVFNGKMLPDDLSFYPPKTDYRYKSALIAPENTFIPLLEKFEFINNVRRQYFIQYPQRVKLSVFNLDTLVPPINERDMLENFNPFRELIKVERAAPLEAPPVETVQIGRKYWVTSGDHRLQFSQTYFSDNWHKGGNNNLAFNNYHVIRATYQKDKVKFDNTFEWRLSLYTSPDDTLRSYNIGDDLLRYYGSFGLDAFLKKWSYSTNLEIKSQLFNNYPVNSNTLRSSFLSPLYVNGGIGMRYQLDKKSEKVRNRRVRLTLDLSPVSLNYIYVLNDEADEIRYGLLEGEKSKFDIGSSLNSSLKYDLTRYITWDSRFKYFTGYNNVLMEFENSLNIMLSQYLSTTLYLYMRYDDGVPKDSKYGYLQINELVSFGLNYKW